MISLIKKLIAPHGISGSEGNVAELIRGLISPHVDECRLDPLGNLIALKRGAGEHHKRIMLCAHMDEIGFLVTHIDEKGFIRFAPIGGIDYLAASYGAVVSGGGVPGILVPEVGVKATELSFEKCYIDIGVRSRREAERRVSIGDFFVLEPILRRLSGKRIAGRPLDDRVGCAALILLAQRLSATPCRDDVYFVFSVQEEVGCRGSRPAAFDISPDLALVCDVTMTGDTPGSKPMAVALGGGAAIKIKDASVICHTDTVDRLIETAKSKKIKYQCEILAAGGTDTSSIQMSGTGCRAAAVSIPARYLHSGVEMIDLADLSAALELIVAFIGGTGDAGDTRNTLLS